MDVKEVLRKAVEEHASDIFIIAGPSDIISFE